MDFLERDLEEILYTSPKESIQDRGLYCFNHSKLYRQFNITGYGIIDLLGVRYRNGNFFVDIYELKNKKLHVGAFLQLTRYIKAVRIVFRDLQRDLNIKNKQIYISGYLIGREIDLDNDFCFIPTVQTDITLFTYSYDLDGIKFKEVVDNYFNTGYKGFDTHSLEYFSFRDMVNELTISTDKNKIIAND